MRVIRSSGTLRTITPCALFGIAILVSSCSKSTQQTSQAIDQSHEAADETANTQQASTPVVRPLWYFSDNARAKVEWAFAGQSSSSVTITNDVSQKSILDITDSVNARYGIDRYFDGFCGYGARLSRCYVGDDSVSRVSFQWDQLPKKTVISIYGTNSSITKNWKQDMTEKMAAAFAVEGPVTNVQNAVTTTIIRSKGSETNGAPSTAKDRR